MSNYIGEETHHIQSANFYNCFVTGYADDEVFGNPGELPLNIHFYNSVLMTDVSDETYFYECVEDSEDLPAYKDSNFRTLDTHAYFYDFRLDSLSTARSKGAAAYSSLYPVDRLGVQRGSFPDAGCYQFE